MGEGRQRYARGMRSKWEKKEGKSGGCGKKARMVVVRGKESQNEVFLFNF